MRKFQVKVNMEKQSKHATKGSTGIDLRREFEILAYDVDDAKVRVKQMLSNEGYNAKLLHHATWTVSRLDHPRKHSD
ncbi:MAG: hypothetical protein JRN15_15045 [Nitrososphaerota archaeon]|nr:hypothetical protein [Nitrososphaerota archaeon]